jgi:guanidinopropionase
MTPLDPAFLPVSGFDLPRFAGLPTFMRLPAMPPEEASARGVDIGIIGVPWDGGTTNRAGARHGPRELRNASTMMRMVNQATGIAPFHTARFADLGDVPPNPASLEDTLGRVENFYKAIVSGGMRPLTAGGDHLTSLPVLRALGTAGPLGMIHFDSHTDLFDSYFGGFRYTHGTPFRRAIEEGLLDPKRVVQIGIRGTTYDGEDREFAMKSGVRVIAIEEALDLGPEATMALAKRIVGERPVYLSFDIDAIDPAQAPGTGTPEVGGFSMHQAQRMVRLLSGLDIVGADLVEVSPPFDVGGITAFAGASLLFELACVMAISVAKAKNRPVVANAALLNVLQPNGNSP